MQEQKREGVEMLVIGGNLQEKDYDKYETIYIEIENYVIMEKENGFIVKCIYIPEVYMKLETTKQEKENVCFSEQR